jgi:hypothetical protein
MTNPPAGALLTPSVVTRWGARGLSLLILLFWGFFIAAHLLGEQGRPSRPLGTPDYLSLTMLAGSLVGLAVAWKWEFPGAVITLLAVLVGAIVNWRVLTFPGTLFVIAAGLFLAAWWLGRAPQHDKPALTQQGGDSRTSRTC